MQLSQHITRVLGARTVTQGDPVPRTGYIIRSGPYFSNSAGIGCLHRLCDELNQRGFPSFTTAENVAAPHLNAPSIDDASAKDLCAQGFIAIYPETTSGNPLNARNVIRWVLNRPGLLGGD